MSSPVCRLRLVHADELPVREPCGAVEGGAGREATAEINQDRLDVWLMPGVPGDVVIELAVSTGHRDRRNRVLPRTRHRNGTWEPGGRILVDLTDRDAVWAVLDEER
ncbi:MAG: hypothetical protein ACRDSL_15615 [Pseudonocardiaceae bacterium]